MAPRAKDSLLCLFTLALLGAAAPAVAQKVYSCTTADGRRLTSDRPLPECADREQKGFTPSTGRVEVIAPKETEAERWARERAQKEAERRRLQEEHQIKQDKQLLLRYPDDVALELRRAYLLDDIKRRWAPTVQEKEQIDAERQALHDRSLARQKQGKLTDYEDAKKAVQLERRTIQMRPMVEKMQAEIDQVNAQMDAELRRVRALRAEIQSNRAKARGEVPASSHEAPELH